MDYGQAAKESDTTLVNFLGPFSLPIPAVQTLTVHIAGCHPTESLLHATLVHEAALPDAARSQTSWVGFDWGSLCACTN